MKRGVIPEPIYLDSNPRWDKDLVEIWLRDQYDIDEFEEKFMQLPANCPVVELLGWIAAHPAMTRRKKGRDVILRVEDIEGAPSRGGGESVAEFREQAGRFLRSASESADESVPGLIVPA